MEVVGRDEAVVVVMVELGPLPLVQRVLYGQGVEIELVGDEGELLGARMVDVHPDDGAFFVEVVGDAFRIEVPVRARSLPVDARADHARTVRRNYRWRPVSARRVRRRATAAADK